VPVKVDRCSLPFQRPGPYEYRQSGELSTRSQENQTGDWDEGGPAQALADTEASSPTEEGVIAVRRGWRARRSLAASTSGLTG
jgi:hypothetical protein